MANFKEPTLEMERSWDEWVASRPQAVREVAAKFKPWKLYLLKSSGHKVFPISFGESDDGITMSVGITGEFNAVAFERKVFGVNPDDLEECDLPGPHETVGAVLTDEQVVENIDEIRIAIRPDLWTRLPNGLVVRKDIN